MKQIVVVFLIALISFSGCDNDNIVNLSQSSTYNNNVLFELDSLGISTDSSDWIYATKTYTNISIPSNISVEFSGYTNLDSTCIMSLYVSASKQGHNYFSYYRDFPSTINTYHSFNILSVGRGNYLNFLAEIIYLNPIINNGYIYFKNIKIYSIN